MRKLITLSAFTLFFMVAFAGNGEKDFTLEKFNAVTVENPLTTESQEFFNHTAKYEIIAQIFVCGAGGIGTNWFETASPTNGTGCLDATQLAATIALYESIYAISRPDACDVVITAQKIEDCIH